MNVKIRDKVIAIMVLLIIIPILSLGISAYKISTNMSKKQYTELGTTIGEQSKILVEAKIEDIRETLEDVGTDPVLIDIAEGDNRVAAISDFRRINGNHGFMDVYYGTTDGTLYSGVQDPNINVTERPWYIKASENDGAVVWSELYKDATTGEDVVTASKTVYNGDKLIGVVAIDIELSNFAEAINKVDVMGRSPMIMDKNGILIVDKTGSVGKPFQGKELFKEDEKKHTIKRVYI